MTDISICMVSLNCWGVISGYLESIYTSQSQPNYEIIIIENAVVGGIPARILRHIQENPVS